MFSLKQRAPLQASPTLDAPSLHKKHGLDVGLYPVTTELLQHQSGVHMRPIVKRQDESDFHRAF
jgi:hypothetical protein